MIINLFTLIISNFIVIASLIYTWYFLQDKTIDLKSKKLYIIQIILMIVTILNYFFVGKFIRFIIILFISIICFKSLFKKNMNKSIVTPIFHQLIMIISEMIFVLILIILNINVSKAITLPIINMVSNIIISIISIIIVRLKITKKIYNIILGYTDKINFMQLCLFCVILILSANILIMSSYYRVEFIYMLIFNTIISTVYFLIIIYSFKVQNKYNRVYDKYNIILRGLEEYENIMNKYRIANHENRNLLLTLRAMALNKENNIEKYIDSIIENKYNDDEKLLFDMSILPSSALRAMIYSQIIKIKKNNINYFLSIDKKLNTIDILELSANTTVEICKIISVYIDNAIDEVKKLRKKYISINLYIEGNNLNIKISNNYKSPIYIDKILEEGYSTKGAEHGYGLSLATKLINRNPCFKNEIHISKVSFSQILSIKYKKTH